MPEPTATQYVQPLLIEPELVSLYSKYVDRISAHYTLSLSQFQLYFGFNAGLFALTGFLAQPALASYFSTGHIALPGFFRILSIAVPIFGVLLSSLWLLVMIDARRWQLLFNTMLQRVEGRMLRDSECGFYSAINSAYAPTRRSGVDLIDVNVFLPSLFGIAWLGALVAGLLWR